MRRLFNLTGYSQEELYFELLNRELIERIRTRAKFEEESRKKQDRREEDEEEEEEELRAS